MRAWSQEGCLPVWGGAWSERVGWGCLPGPGGCLPGPGGYLPGPGGCLSGPRGDGLVSQHAPRQTPPVNRITDACENITLPQLRCGQ